jgi:hypothetical protein
MSRCTAAWLAWSVWAACVVLITLALVLDFTTEELPLDVGGLRYHPGFAVLTGVLSLAYPAVGALIASRLPTNPIGWIFCGLGLIYVTQRFTRRTPTTPCWRLLPCPGVSSRPGSPCG